MNQEIRNAQQGKISGAYEDRARVFATCLLENANDLVAAVDADLRFVGLNAAFRREFELVFGRPVELGQRVEQALAHLSGDRNRAVMLCQRALAGESFRAIEEFGDRQLLRKTYELALSPILDTHGQPLMVAIVVRDLTLQRLAEQRFGALLEASPDAMIIVRADGVIDLTNAHAERMFQFGRQELIGRPVEMLLPERLRGGHVGHRRQFIAEAKARPMGSGRTDLLGLRADGSEFPVEISLNPLNVGGEKMVVAAIRDMTLRQRAEDRLRELAAQLERRVVERTAALERANRAPRPEPVERERGHEWRAEIVDVLESMNDIFFAFDADWRITYVNAAAERSIAMARQSVLGRNYWEVFPAALGSIAEREFRRAMAQRVAVKFEIFYEPYGQWFEVDAFPVKNGGLAEYASNITERKRGEQAALQLAAIVASSDDAIIGKTLDGTIVSWNAGATRMYGYSEAEMLGRPISTLVPPELADDTRDILERIRRGERVEHHETVRLCKDGRRIDVSLSVSPIRGPAGVTGAAAIGRDISERKQADERLRHMAGHDALTGLPNRALLQDRLGQAIAYANRNHSRVAILFIDLDRFKNINDSLGHHIGDALLKMAAARLLKCLREGDSVARLGGDEFVLSLALPSDSGDAALVAQKALDALAQPFVVEGRELHIGASIGISLYPDDGADVETLMRTADTAMYHAKETGRGKFQFFTAELNQAAQQRLVVGARLRHALAHDEFILHYQPQVTMDDGAIFSVEALLRWQAPGGGPISCGDFIANAEESGLIVPIGAWALRQACRQLSIWRDAGRPDLKMAVNLSPRQLEQADFCALVAQILDETALPASALELEITESILLQRSEFNLATLTRLSQMGIALSVDDFGTGYSSLAYLQRFPVKALKIDQSFVRDIGNDSNDTALITAIIAMANSLHLKVVAEGVETPYQARFLLAHGCLAGQGFYYSQAVPAETLLELFGSNLKAKPGPRP